MRDCLYRYLYAYPNERVRGLKESIHKTLLHHEIIHPDNLELIFTGRTLKDWKTLSDYNIQSGATLHVLFIKPL